MVEAKNFNDANEFFNELSKIENSVKLFISYLSKEPLDLLPKNKRKNPETNRMKNYPDFELLQNELGIKENISEVIKITNYSNLQYVRPDILAKKYAVFRSKKDEINEKYGLNSTNKESNIGKYSSLDESGSTKTYCGENTDKIGKIYFPQNTYGAIIETLYYAVDENDNIIIEIKKDSISKYIKKRNPDGVDALKRLGKTEEEIKNYLSEIDSLKMRYQQFDSSKISNIIVKSENEEEDLLIYKNIRNDLL